MPDEHLPGAPRVSRWRTAALISLVPCALLALPLALHPWVGPFSAARYNDPAYTYLFNSLLLAVGEAPRFVAHPGTPVEALGAGVLWLRGAASGEAGSGQELVAAVLTRPEPCLRSISAALLAVLALATWRLGRRLTDVLGGTGYGLVGQAALLGSPAVLTAIHGVAAEQLLLPVGLLLGIATLPLAMSPAAPGAIGGRNRALSMGGLLGLGIATKFTCLPLVALVLALRRRRLLLLAGGAAVAAFALATAPVWSRYGAMLDWLVSVAIHSGQYGTGEVGLPPLDRMLRRGVRLLAFEPVLPLAAVLGLGALWMSYRRRALAGAGPGAVLAGGLLAIAGVVALTLKDPGQPRYLIPAIAVAAVLLPLALRVLLAGRERVLGPLALTVMVIAVGVAVVQVSHLMRERAHEQRTHERLVAAAVGRGCLLVPVDKSSAPPYALAFGNAMSSGRFATALQAMYPGFVYYSLYDFRESPFHPGFSSWGGTIGLDQVRAASEGRPLCLASQYDLTATTDLPIDEIALGGPRESFHAERLFVMAAP